LAQGAVVSVAEDALEAAILAALQADEDVAELLGSPLRVMEAGSSAPRYPFLELGRHVSEPRDGLDVEMSEHRIDLAIVSRDQGGGEARTGVAAVRASLTGAALAMEGWRCVLLTPLFADATRQKVGLWRGLLRLKALVERT
jgi:hypothetical protein